jgi:hypothetical protein
MRQIINWKQDRPGSGRSTAMLGAVTVGAVLTGEDGARWMDYLPEGSFGGLKHWQDAKTEESARAALSAHVLSWLRDAGVIDLAERDRADAAALPLFTDLEA